MKNKFKIYTTSFLLSAVLVTVSSCKKDFKEINTTPNGSEFALPKALLAPAITSVVRANMNRSQRINNELMQITINMGDQEGKIFRYEIRASEADYLWNAWYIELTNFNDIYEGASPERLNIPSYQGIALIMQAYVFSLLTDTYGNVPFKDANKGKLGIKAPPFDLQQDIYTGIFEKLEAANTILASSVNVAESSDPIYEGNVSNWRKFGNSLYLRLLMRVSAKAEFNAPAKIAEIVETNAANYPIMTSNDDSAILRWTGSSPYVSPFATTRDADWYTPKLGEFFVDNLGERSDPRIQSWATLFEGEYQGIPSGYSVGEAPQGKSAFPLSLQVEPLLGNILNYGELQLILAEAAVKGYISKSAKTYYETGAASGITLWGYTVPNNYFTFAKVKWDDSYSFEQKMELIFIQKYYALFFTDLQSWIEYRRTGYPSLPKGAGLANNGIMPARLTYPVYVQSANPTNYKEAVQRQGPDEVTTQVWWQRP
ncbi:MAG TPA: SusD/RagB family nutrient-binding outer membrane lipoprotein [Pelobium sp.]|nr:SusD/RagB family nutrient-binding outer membrane lipoprotein [Pelobium sp.]